MTDQTFDEYDDDEPSVQPAGDGKDLRLLRKKARDYDALVSQHTDLQRKYAFSGVQLPDTPIAQLFRDKYDGDLDPARVREAAAQYGLIEKMPDPLAEELAAHQRMAGASSGAEARPGAITPEDVASWPMDKMRRFQQRYPDDWNALKRGDEVIGINDF
jgi:hypothetical protein